MKGYDLDGVLTAGVEPEGDFVIISGRTFGEYNDTCRNWAKRAPLYIRGSGEHGDVTHAAHFKIAMVALLGVTEFFEDDWQQADMMRRALGDRCRVHLVDGHRLRPLGMPPT